MTDKEMQNVLACANHIVKYGAVCYTQINRSNIADGEFRIKYPYSELPSNGLLFLVPQFSSIEAHTDIATPIYNKLIIQYPQLNPVTGVASYTGEKKYVMVKETPEGTHNHVTKGDIIANRLAIFRFIAGDSDNIILVNNPQYNNIQISTLHVTQDASFESIPVYKQSRNVEIPLALSTEVLALENRIRKLENKFLYGTVDAEEALADADEGTIYIKIEEA
jgi:hypothetical protein